MKLRELLSIIKDDEKSNVIIEKNDDYFTEIYNPDDKQNIEDIENHYGEAEIEHIKTSCGMDEIPNIVIRIDKNFVLLKPCPFCGSKAVIKNHGYQNYIMCQDCRVNTKYVDYQDVESIVNEWNSRCDMN